MLNRPLQDPPGRALPPPGRSSAVRERLAFNYGQGTVAGRGMAEAAIVADAAPSFATAVHAEPRDWGYFGLLAFTAVIFLRPQDTVPALGALHLAEVFAIIGIGPMLLHRFARRLPVFRVTPETVGVFVLGFVILATTPFSIWPGGAMAVFLDVYIKIIVVFVLMMNTLTTPKRLEQITWVILLCCGYIAARGVFDYARGVNLVEGSRLAGPVSGMFGNPNDLAMNMVTFMPMAGVVAMSARHSTLRRLTAAVVVALMLATIVFTKSRGGAVGLVVMLVSLILLGRKVRPGFGTIAVMAVLVAMPFMPASFWTRMTSILDEKQDRQQFTGSRESRIEVMQEGFNTFLEHPFTGVGAGQFHNYNPPGRLQRWRETHNALLQVAAETGIAGLLAFSFLIVRGAMAATSTRRMLTRRRKRGSPDPARTALTEDDRSALYAHAVGVSAGLIGWFVCALFASITYSWTFYYVLALTVAARELTRDRLFAPPTDERKAFSVPSLRGRSRPAAGAA
jgi:O-antigen ligase